MLLCCCVAVLPCCRVASCCRVAGAPRCCMSLLCRVVVPCCCVAVPCCRVVDRVAVLCCRAHYVAVAVPCCLWQLQGTQQALASTLHARRHYTQPHRNMLCLHHTGGEPARLSVHAPSRQTTARHATQAVHALHQASHTSCLSCTIHARGLAHTKPHAHVTAHACKTLAPVPPPCRN